MVWLRTLAFWLIAYGGSVILVLLVPIPALIGTRSLRAYANGWTRFMVWCARWIAGIRIEARGQPLGEPALYVGKHQSFLETFYLAHRLDSPAIVMKRELMQIPVWGWAARRYGMIVVDREANAKALRALMRDAEVALAEGRSVLIFPEGTRVLPGETPPLKSGFAGLYRILRLPVVPVALKSGHVWSRAGVVRPGVVPLAFEEVIPPGLARGEVEARAHAAINALEAQTPVGA